MKNETYHPKYIFCMSHLGRFWQIMSIKKREDLFPDKEKGGFQPLGKDMEALY